MSLLYPATLNGMLRASATRKEAARISMPTMFLDDGGGCIHHPLNLHPNRPRQTFGHRFDLHVGRLFESIAPQRGLRPRRQFKRD